MLPAGNVKRSQGSLTRAVLCGDCYGLEFRYDARRPHVNSDQSLICTATHLPTNTVNHNWLDQPLHINPHHALPPNEPLDVQLDRPLLQRLRHSRTQRRAVAFVPTRVLRSRRVTSRERRRGQRDLEECSSRDVGAEQGGCRRDFFPASPQRC